jgi:cephalosporin-C deacetylase
MSVSALLELRPWLAGRISFVGHSFSGGVGALALACDDRVSRGHLDVPTFGHQPLRLTLPTTGSAASVQAFVRENVHARETLALYDSAVAARYITQPMHLAVALSDPVVVPPGQFAVFNALPGPKRLFVRRAGHVVHAESVGEDRNLIAELRGFLCLDDDDDQPRVPPLAQRPPRS